VQSAKTRGVERDATAGLVPQLDFHVGIFELCVVRAKKELYGTLVGPGGSCASAQLDAKDRSTSTIRWINEPVILRHNFDRIELLHGKTLQN